MNSFLLSSILIGFAYADPVSMLQETRPITCVPIKTAKNYDSFVLDKKDTKLTQLKAGKPIHEFERIKFLDSAVLLRSLKNPETYAVFQIFLNGSASLTEGRLISMKEKDCEDTGASKTCSNESLKKLFWSPEKLLVEYEKVRQAAPIDSYGFLANHATYFRAGGITLIDYGAPVEIIVGSLTELNCKY